jgi:hypothetical protein
MNNPNQGGAAGGDDYLDKAFNAGAKKFGGAQGQKIAANRGMSEKIVCTLTLPPFGRFDCASCVERELMK